MAIRVCMFLECINGTPLVILLVKKEKLSPDTLNDADSCVSIIDQLYD